MHGFPVQKKTNTNNTAKKQKGGGTPSLSYGIEEMKRTLPIQSLTDNGAAGWKIALVGESKSGKTDSALTLGYLNLEFEDMLEKAGYTEIIKSLKNGTIRQVERILVIDSENALNAQMRYPYERKLLGPLLKEDRFSFIPIPIENLRKVASPDGEIAYDRESIDKMTQSLKLFTAAIDSIPELDPGTLVIIDSMSIYKLLLDTVTGFMAQVRASKSNDPRERSDLRMERWQERNAWWLDSLRKIRSFTGWSVSTFMVKTISDWVVDAFKTEKNVPIWTETTPYNYDMVVEMSIERNTNVRIAKVTSARYMSVDNPNDNEIHIYGKVENDTDRVQFLELIEKNLRIANGKE